MSVVNYAQLNTSPLHQMVRQQLFASNEQGVWYDPSDFSTMFQDAAGTVPVTAVEQPVGRILDKSGRGNHATQATAASRPVLSARKNLCTVTEALSIAAPWALSDVNWTITPNAIVAPDGTQTADLLTSTGVAAATPYAVGPTGSTVITASVYVKKSNLSYLNFLIRNATTSTSLNGGGYNFDTDVLSGTSYTRTLLPNGWVRITATQTTGFTTSDHILFYVGATAAVPAGQGWYVWGIQCEAGPTATSYQRVNTATDYDTAGFQHYLRFDGVDDSLSTSSINFTATDKMTVWAGVHKASDASTAILLELSSNSNTIRNAFSVAAPYGGGPTYGWQTRGTSSTLGEIGPAGAPAPNTSVLTCIGDIAADIATIRKNGVFLLNGTQDQGTGTYGDYPLFIGRRNNASLPFNGRLYGLIVRGAASNANQIALAEKFLANKTGVALP